MKLGVCQLFRSETGRLMFAILAVHFQCERVSGGPANIKKIHYNTVGYVASTAMIGFYCNEEEERQNESEIIIKTCFSIVLDELRCLREDASSCPFNIIRATTS